MTSRRTIYGLLLRIAILSLALFETNASKDYDACKHPDPQKTAVDFDNMDDMSNGVTQEHHLGPSDTAERPMQTERSDGYSTQRHKYDPDKNAPGIRRKQHSITVSSEISCTAAFSIHYNVTVHDPVVVEFRMRQRSEFVINRCYVLLTAPNTMTVSVVLLGMSCDVQGSVVIKDYHSYDPIWKSCVRQINPGVDWMSDESRAIFRVEVYGDGLFTARMNVMAVTKPEPGTIQTRYLTPMLGYIQNAGIQLNHLYWRLFHKPDVANTWSYLTVPGRSVALISVAIAGLGSLPPQKVCQHRVELYEGSMNKTVWRVCSRCRSQPQPHISYEGGVHVHFVIGQNKDILMHGIGFRLIYTFHKKSNIPVRLSTGKWNCSTLTWLAFHYHFICDLVIQCAGGEDETDCPVTEQCGHNGLLWQGKCHSLVKLDSGTSWHTANAVCSKLGLRSHLGSIAKDDGLMRRLRYDLVINSGHLMLLGVSSASVDSHL